ncbi:Cysteine-type peptidase activity protein [Trebouxia sp. C0010 RCD-2024]
MDRCAAYGRSRGQLSLQALARLCTPKNTETCWHVLVSLWKQYLPKWLAAHGNSGIDSKSIRKPPNPPDPQHLFQAADQETDRTVVLTGPKSYQASRGDFRCLQACNWLNDEIVNLYLQLLQIESSAAKAAGQGVPKAYLFSTFFWTRLACFGKAVDYAGVASWTKKVDIFSHDLLIFPINHNNLHWCLAMANLSSSTIYYYDSMLGSGLSGHAEAVVLSTLEGWLQEEARRKGCQIQERLEKVTVRDDLPEQHDGSSCGVFVCQYARRLLQGAQVQRAFSQQDIPELRLQMATQLLDAFGQPNGRS